MPYLFVRTRATVRQCPCVPARSWIVEICLLLVASRPQMVTFPRPRYATNGKRKAVRTGLTWAAASDDECRKRPLWYGLLPPRSCRPNHVSSETPERQTWYSDSA